jgi:hypothetical protein
MDGSRFDHMARALGRRGTRRGVLGAALAAITGGAILADRQTSAQACAASGTSCATAACCAGFACDAKTKKCLGGPGATCRISSNCANGQLCKSGKCSGAAVCRALNESCSAAANGCCTNLQCVAGKNVCLGLAGFNGCTKHADCVKGLFCNAGVCGSGPTPTPTPARLYAAECDLIIEPGTDVVPEGYLASGTTTCLAAGNHYLVNRWLATHWDGGGGSIYGRLDGSTIVHTNWAVDLTGPAVLANLTIKQAAGSYGSNAVQSEAAPGNVVISSVTIEGLSYRALLAADEGTTTVTDSTLLGVGKVLWADGGTVVLQNTTVTGGEYGVYISDLGSVTMNATSKVINNANGADEGAAVYIDGTDYSYGGSFTNNGGTISGNVSSEDDCDNDVMFWTGEYICCTNAGNGKTGTCSIPEVEGLALPTDTPKPATATATLKPGTATRTPKPGTATATATAAPSTATATATTVPPTTVPPTETETTVPPTATPAS